jgi:hypothetical protein
MDCPAITEPDGLEPHADADGIVCLSPVKGELAAAGRLSALLADAYGADWTPQHLTALLSAATDGKARDLDTYLRDHFFKRHVELFQNRPFIWHVWDGRQNGFHALVNYHKLAAPDGEGRRTLEKLVYSYLRVGPACPHRHAVGGRVLSGQCRIRSWRHQPAGMRHPRVDRLPWCGARLGHHQA